MIPSTFTAGGESLLELLQEAGVREVWFGVESADEGLREKYNKPPFTNQQLKKITRELQKAGIFCCWYLVVGFEDTAETIQATVNLVKEVKPSRIFITDLVPYYPGEGRINLEKMEKNIAEVKQFQQRLQDLADEING
jgi:radical SAM superfamily enzyme YgiQ (UPF0313 family)